MQLQVIVAFGLANFTARFSQASSCSNSLLGPTTDSTFGLSLIIDSIPDGVRVPRALERDACTQGRTRTYRN